MSTAPRCADIAQTGWCFQQEVGFLPGGGGNGRHVPVRMRGLRQAQGGLDSAAGVGNQRDAHRGGLLFAHRRNGP
jgi:hypothetical protein